MFKADLIAFYEASYALIGVYLATKGNENLFMEKIIIGLSFSLSTRSFKL
jgi:hypothetical protein